METKERAATVRPPADYMQTQRQPARSAQPARPAVPRRMPRAEALALTHRLKRRLLVASLGVFALLAGLTAQHITGAASASASSSQSQQSSNGQSSSFFGSQSGSGSFGSSSGSSSSAVSGTSTS